MRLPIATALQSFLSDYVNHLYQEALIAAAVSSFKLIANPDVFCTRIQARNVQPQLTTFDLLASRAGCIILSHISATSRSLPRIAWE